MFCAGAALCDEDHIVRVSIEQAQQKKNLGRSRPRTLTV